MIRSPVLLQPGPILALGPDDQGQTRNESFCFFLQKEALSVLFYKKEQKTFIP
jgi:hypothetical protein